MSICAGQYALRETVSRLRFSVRGTSLTPGAAKDTEKINEMTNADDVGKKKDEDLVGRPNIIA